MSLADAGLAARTLELLKLSNYFTVAGIAVVLADYVHTLSEEIELIWPTRLSVPKLIFFAVRYGNILLGLLESIYTFSPILSPKGCKKMFNVITVSDVLLSSLGEAIIYLRVVAFSGRHYGVIRLLASVFATINVLAAAFVIKWILSVKGAPEVSSTNAIRNLTRAPAVESLSMVPGFSCMVLQGNTLYTTLLHGELLFSVTFLAVMMVAIGLHRYKIAGLSYRNRGGGLLAQFYHTGIGYFLALIVLNTVNIIVNLLGPAGARYMLTRFQIHAHGVIVIRIILHLRAYSERANTISIGSLDVRGGDESAMAGFSVPGPKKRIAHANIQTGEAG